MRLITYDMGDSPLRNYHQFYLRRLKVGLVSAIVGSSFLKTGTGKSWTGLSMGEDNDDDFHVGKVVYNVHDFLRGLDEIESSGKVSQALVVDEGEITAPSNMYYSFLNRAISFTLSTVRYLRSMAIFVTPSFYGVDKRVRILTSHVGMCTKTYDSSAPGETEVRMRYYRVTTDFWGDNIFLKKITMFNRTTKRPNTFPYFRVRPPSEDLAEEYEKKSREFKKDLRGVLAKEAATLRAVERGEEATEDKKAELKRITEKLLEFPAIRERLATKGKVPTSLVEVALMDEDNVTARKAQQLAQYLKIMHRGKDNHE